jgi:hypothetical protein
MLGCVDLGAPQRQGEVNVRGSIGKKGIEKQHTCMQQDASMPSIMSRVQ